VGRAAATVAATALNVHDDDDGGDDHLGRC